MSSDASRWQIIIDRDAERSLRRLPKNIARRIRTAIYELGDNPRPPGCIKLSGYDLLWRIRIGQWRIVYAIHDDELVIIVVEVEPRGSAYRNL